MCVQYRIICKYTVYLSNSPRTFLFGSFQEAILEEQESRKDDNIHLTRFLRVLANFLVMCCLAGSGYLIYFVVRRSQKFALDGLENHTWWERNEVEIRHDVKKIIKRIIFYNNTFDVSECVCFLG